MKAFKKIDSWVIRHSPFATFGVGLGGLLMEGAAKFLVGTVGVDAGIAALSAGICLVGYGLHMLVKGGTEMTTLIGQANREGFRSRIGGGSLSENPYRRWLERRAFKAWREGWTDAHRAIGGLKLLR
ncbi:hypothetical protein [Paraburkholderia humisilvae]|uniref:Uncharacterized protein n=1 Tax=Paraburkholderia humisilvae TaxID=627669 RepID=A0A6J5DNA1_9BURK|nr:hypothetical protein [Paraburkholderia humisilvae]CAB3754475.1 hypothetical protein LMG29542_02362 [Paraburkholderia humisilvae]